MEEQHFLPLFIGSEITCPRCHRSWTINSSFSHEEYQKKILIFWRLVYVKKKDDLEQTAQQDTCHNKQRAAPSLYQTTSRHPFFYSLFQFSFHFSYRLLLGFQLKAQLPLFFVLNRRRNASWRGCQQRSEKKLKLLLLARSSILHQSF